MGLAPGRLAVVGWSSLILSRGIVLQAVFGTGNGAMIVARAGSSLGAFDYRARYPEFPRPWARRMTESDRSPTIRGFDPADLDEILGLFRDTVRTVNRRDYSAKQVAAWAPDTPDREAWLARLAVGWTLGGRRWRTWHAGDRRLRASPAG